MTFKEGIKQVERINEQLIDADRLMSETVINAFMFTWQWWFGIGYLLFLGLYGFYLETGKVQADFLWGDLSPSFYP